MELHTLRRSVLSIARRQWKDRYSGVTCSPTAIARASSREVTPYGVTESLGIAPLSRGHSYGVAGSTGDRGAIERTLLRSVALPRRNTTPVKNYLWVIRGVFHTASDETGMLENLTRTSVHVSRCRGLPGWSKISVGTSTWPRC